MTQIHKNILIPIEVNDIIQPKGFINKFKVKDIIFISRKTQIDDTIILELELLDYNINNTKPSVLKFNYDEYEWIKIKE